MRREDGDLQDSPTEAREGKQNRSLPVAAAEEVQSSLQQPKAGSP